MSGRKASLSKSDNWSFFTGLNFYIFFFAGDKKLFANYFFRQLSDS